MTRGRGPGSVPGGCPTRPVVAQGISPLGAECQLTQAATRDAARWVRSADLRGWHEVTKTGHGRGEGSGAPASSGTRRPLAGVGPGARPLWGVHEVDPSWLTNSAQAQSAACSGAAARTTLRSPRVSRSPTSYPGFNFGWRTADESKRPRTMATEGSVEDSE